MVSNTSGYAAAYKILTNLIVRSPKGGEVDP